MLRGKGLTTYPGRYDTEHHNNKLDSKIHDEDLPDHANL